MFSSSSSLLLLTSFFQAVACGTTRFVPRDGSSPSLPYNDNTSKYCSWWIDYNSVTTCSALVSDNFISLEDFRRWNPSITADCGNLVVGKSYCVEAVGEPAPGPAPSSSPISSARPSSSAAASSTLLTSATPSRTLPPTVTSTSVGNGVATPQPTQPGMVGNCAKFHWIAKGVNCDQVTSYQKITREDFVKWNPTVNADCSGMWAEVNVCVGVIGGSTPTPPKPSSTTPGNGVQTPQPTQPGMVGNCAKFHWIAKGVSCGQVISYQKITLPDFVKWNPTVKDDCSGMWAEVNVCVGVIGGSTPAPVPAPTPTKSAGNGIQTPQPTQPGMVTNCKKFHFVAKNVVCSQIISYQKITLADFIKWNTGIKSDCSNMWSDAHVCVGV
ncbi:hypothetical protein CC86DRAFT_398182 [Ophiobolus disseminans]|uniref:LysM domain-containing protein n=1 Tax=Ophiobolus disseminans TaxID=1469910 RepID=A0A6A6ZI54_9PLEO|nr:hypothetical protein CC86DRAFT_398182 [Ophiobolus disseminans]